MKFLFYSSLSLVAYALAQEDLPALKSLRSSVPAERPLVSTPLPSATTKYKEVAVEKMTSFLHYENTQKFTEFLSKCGCAQKVSQMQSKTEFEQFLQTEKYSLKEFETSADPKPNDDKEKPLPDPKPNDDKEKPLPDSKPDDNKLSFPDPSNKTELSPVPTPPVPYQNNTKIITIINKITQITSITNINVVVNIINNFMCKKFGDKCSERRKRPHRHHHRRHEPKEPKNDKSSDISPQEPEIPDFDKLPDTLPKDVFEKVKKLIDDKLDDFVVPDYVKDDIPDGAISPQGDILKPLPVPAPSNDEIAATPAPVVIKKKCGGHRL